MYEYVLLFVDEFCHMSQDKVLQFESITSEVFKTFCS